MPDVALDALLKAARQTMPADLSLGTGHRRMTPRLLRVAALLIVTMWTAAIFLPVRQVIYGYGGQAEVTRLEGWTLPAYGWLGPLAFNVAWYANPLLLFIIIRLTRGKPPGSTLSRIAFGLSLTVLIPALLYDFERDGRLHPVVTSGPAIWLWLGAMVVPVLISLRTRVTNKE